MISPESPDDSGQVLWEQALLLSCARQSKQLPGVVLGRTERGPVRQAELHPSSRCPKLGKHSQDLFLGSGNGQRGEGGSTYRTRGVGKVNLQIAHGFDDGHDGLDGVAVDDCPVLPTFLL